ncbi:TonB-dependent receptor [Niastella vici]|uniref:TonB-dependent receptor n=1 Tax=Niastella vici TaxID=1703345 RepID=A0A1V9FLE6_9BACT|nr:TonB-dependent receptor [Niastella vici]OQP59165.1 TonB-dependent receptor [Niastella vici]
MKKMILGICYLLFTHCLTAQISGKITDAASSTPIASATVELSNGLSTLTNDKGVFEFKKVKPGNYTLHITSIGFQSADQPVASGNTIDIKLNRLNLFLQPVEIKATRADDKAPFTKNNLSKKEIEKLNLGQDLPFILNQTPSVVVNSDAGNGVGYTGIRIRGSDATRINVTLNGIPYNDAESQGTFFVDLPDFTSSVNSIQVQRGVGTSSNGAAAFGATINLSTNETNTTPYSEINNTYGSFNTWKNTVKAGSGLIADHFTIDARLSKVSSDGFIDRASSTLKSFYLSAAYLNKNTSIRMNVFSGNEKTYQAWNGIPEAKLRNNDSALLAHYYNNLGPLYYTQQDSLNLFKSDPRKYNYFTYGNQTDNYQQDHYQLFINHDLNGRLAVNTAFFLSRGKGYYEEYKPVRSYADYGLNDLVTGSDTIRSTDLVQQQWLDNYFYGQVFSIQYKDNTNQLIVGGGWNRYDGKHYGNVIWSAMGGIPNNYRWYNKDAYKTDVNAYAKYQVKIADNLQAFVDLQYRRVLYYIGGFKDNPALKLHNTWDFFNPKAGFVYAKNNYQIYASYSQGKKEPNRDDFEAGINQQPKAEKLHDFELGVEEKNSDYSWGATLYYMQYKDQLVLSGKINDVGAYTRTNVPNSYRLGIELQGAIRFTQWLNAAGNITLSKNQIKNFTEYYDNYDSSAQKAIPHGNTDIAFSPAIIASGILNIIPCNNVEISLPAKYAGRQYLDNTSNKNRSLDPYYVQDARISYTLRKTLFKESTFIVQVNNVFNKKYEPNGYTYSYQYDGKVITENFYYPMAGTNFMIGLNVKL